MSDGLETCLPEVPNYQKTWHKADKKSGLARTPGFGQTRPEHLGREVPLKEFLFGQPTVMSYHEANLKDMGNPVTPGIGNYEDN